MIIRFHFVTYFIFLVAYTIFALQLRLRDTASSPLHSSWSYDRDIASFDADADLGKEGKKWAIIILTALIFTGIMNYRCIPDYRDRALYASRKWRGSGRQETANASKKGSTGGRGGVLGGSVGDEGEGRGFRSTRATLAVKFGYLSIKKKLAIVAQNRPSQLLQLNENVKVAIGGGNKIFIGKSSS